MGAGWRFEIELALRYFRSARADAMIALLSRVTAGGLAVGVAALILALAALSGFQHRLLSEVRARTPTLQVALDADTDVGELIGRVERVEGVAAVQQVVYGAGWIPRAGEVSSVELIGFEKRLPEWMPADQAFAPEPAPESRAPSSTSENGLGGAVGLVLSSGSVRRWRLSPGDVVEVVSPRSTLTPIGLQPSSRRMPVTAAHDPGTADERLASRVAMPLHLALGLVGGADRWLDLTLAPGADDQRVQSGLELALGADSRFEELEIRSWRDVHRALLFVLRLEKTAVFLAVVLIVLVSSFALVAALSLILASKQAEVGILSAMGVAPRRIRRLFLWLGGLLALSGTVGGAVIGVSLALVLERFRLLRLPGGVYIVDHVPFLVRASDLWTVLASAVLVTLMAAALGSKRAASLDPIEALRQ